MTDGDSSLPDAYDVVVVGGGPAGCSAAVFTARYGLDTLVFDRGKSSVGRCAHLENYLGFPGGIGVPRFSDLMHDHVAAAGGEVADDLVESIFRSNEGDRLEATAGDRVQADADAHAQTDAGGGTREDAGFVVETQDGRRVVARRVVAATRYDGEYLRPLGGDAMFESREYDGEERERFDRSYPDRDGSTPVAGLFVASPAEGPDRQAILAAGRGARVGLAVVEAVRRERGVPEALADYHDWVRRETELTDEWTDRDAWREWLDGRLPDDHGLSEERRVDVREREIDRRLDQYVSADEIERRNVRAQERLLDHVDDERILACARELEDGGPTGDR